VTEGYRVTEGYSSTPFTGVLCNQMTMRSALLLLLLRASIPTVVAAAVAAANA